MLTSVLAQRSVRCDATESELGLQRWRAVFVNESLLLLQSAFLDDDIDHIRHR